jgi:hypothetical protein
VRLTSELVRLLGRWYAAGVFDVCCKCVTMRLAQDTVQRTCLKTPTIYRKPVRRPLCDSLDQGTKLTLAGLLAGRYMQRR